MSWQYIIRKTTNLQFFLYDTFNIPISKTQNLKASKGLKQSINDGTLVDKITEEYFEIMATFVDRITDWKSGLDRLIWSLEKLSEGYPLYLTDYRK